MTDYTLNTPVPWPVANDLSSAMIADLQLLQLCLMDGWTDWASSFALTATTTNPVLNNGSKVAEVKRIGSTVVCRFFLVFGSTSTFGSGNYTVNYPVTPDSRANSNFGVVGYGAFYDSSADTRYPMVITSDSTTKARLSTNAAVGGMSPTSPVTIAQNDRFSGVIVYTV